MMKWDGAGRCRHCRLMSSLLVEVMEVRGIGHIFSKFFLRSGETGLELLFRECEGRRPSHDRPPWRKGIWLAVLAGWAAADGRWGGGGVDGDGEVGVEA